MKKERIKQRYSRRQLAELVGCSPSMLVQIESGTREPSLKMARKIASILGKSVDFLFCQNAEQIGSNK